MRPLLSYPAALRRPFSIGLLTLPVACAGAGDDGAAPRSAATPTAGAPAATAGVGATGGGSATAGNSSALAGTSSGPSTAAGAGGTAAGSGREGGGATSTAGAGGAAGSSGSGGVAGGGAPAIAGQPVNLALNQPTFPAEMAKLVDGSLTSGTVNFGTSGSFYLDFGKPTAIGRAIFAQIRGHAFAQQIAFAKSDDAQSWQEIWNGKSGVDYYMFLETELVLPATTTRYFKVTYAEPYIDGFILESELELYAPNTSSADLALGKQVTASVNTKYETPLSIITDGKVVGDPWHSDSKPGAITVDLGTNTTINRLRLTSDTHNAATQSSFDISEDNKSWQSVFAQAGGGEHHIAFEPVSTRYVRCNIQGVDLSDAGSPGLVVRELSVYGPAN